MQFAVIKLIFDINYTNLHGTDMYRCHSLHCCNIVLEDWRFPLSTNHNELLPAVNG